MYLNIATMHLQCLETLGNIQIREVKSLRWPTAFMIVCNQYI